MKQLNYCRLMYSGTWRRVVW